MKTTIVLFYKYVTVENPKELRDREYAVCEVLGLKGRVIIAEEGINATLEGSEEAIHTYIAHLKKDKRFKNVDFKTSEGTGNAFPRLSVKVKKEICASGLPATVDPRVKTARHIPPDELKKMYERGEDFTIIDMRNTHEYDVGHFRGSIHPSLTYFRELQNKKDVLLPHKDKKVITVCTGGVRCEKASAYLLSLGFTDVSQLDGGMHRYMEKFPGQDFEGALYVFDDRVVWQNVPASERTVVGTCAHCSAPTETFIDCGNDRCAAHLLVCGACMNKYKEGDKVFCSHECKDTALYARQTT